LQKNYLGSPLVHPITPFKPLINAVVRGISKPSNLQVKKYSLSNQKKFDNGNNLRMRNKVQEIWKKFTVLEI
jgi:hypothetical protein